MTDQACDIARPLADVHRFLDWANQVGEVEIERDSRVLYALYCEICEVCALAPLTKQMLLRRLIGSGARKRRICVKKRDGTRSWPTVYLLPYVS